MSRERLQNLERINVMLVEAGDERSARVQQVLREIHSPRVGVVSVLGVGEARVQLHHRTDLILLDLGSPHTNSLSDIHALYCEATEVPIIALTGSASTNVGLLALEQGAQDYLDKEELNPRMLRRVMLYAIGRKRAEADIRESRRRLDRAQRLEAIGLMAGGVAHDFNNLLTTIMGFANLIHRKLGPEHEVSSDVEEIVSASQRATLVTRKLLNMAKSQKSQLQPVSVNELVEDMVKLLRRVIGEDIELVTVLGDGLPCVKADPTEIEQVIMNLAVNARDAMPVGGKLCITTTVEEDPPSRVREQHELGDGPFVRISVADTGEGIPSEIQRKVFEPFFSTKEASKGTGLGLSSVCNIMKKCRGGIDLYSASGMGTDFHLYFPTTEHAPISLGMPKEGLPRGRETVLLVEDEETVRHLATRYLRDAGYEVIQARNGQVALDIFALCKQPIELVLTDVVMPKLCGPEMVAELEKLGGEFRVLYMSGFTDGLLEEHGAVKETSHFLSKPFTRENFVQKVREVLDQPPLSVAS